MSATVISLGTRSLADAIAEADMEIGVLEDLEGRQHAAWQQTAAELEHAVTHLLAVAGTARPGRGSRAYRDACHATKSTTGGTER